MKNGRSKMHNRLMFDWNDLKCFLAVARRGSTLAAAKMLGLSQSTVHRRLDELERRIGRQLVKRHPTGYRLTEFGTDLVPLVERVEEAVTAIERRIASTEPDLTGTLRVTCPESVGFRLMRSPLLDKFNARFPGLRVEIVMSDKPLNLARGEADIAIRAGEPRDKSLVARKIANSPWGVYASRPYLERYGPITCVEDLNHHAVASYDGAMADGLAARWLRRVAPAARVAARGDGLSTLLLAVKAGTALAPLPIVLGKQDSDLVCVLGPIPELSSPFYLLMHQDMKETPRVRAFVEFVVSELPAVRILLAA